MKKLLKALTAIFIILFLLGAPVWLVFKYEAVYDWWRLRGYTPPAEIVALADHVGMTPLARHDLYINRPQLIPDSNNFRKNCPNAEQTIVLGCYLAGEGGIYVYKVQDQRLKGILEVTAAHETLHGAYERLSSKDKHYINGLLQDYYQHGLSDQRIKDSMAAYKKTEPDALVDEMHSVFGTEAGNLPAALESYYQRYFANRAVIVGLANQYEREFSSRIAQINAYDEQLTGLKKQIDATEQNLKQRLAEISAERARLDSLLASDQKDAYNQSVPAFNNSIETYNRDVRALQAQIASYNQLVESRNSLAKDLRSLQASIDTRLSPQPAQ